MSPSILWFRRDLRLGDHPALLAAREDGGAVLPVFVRDPRLLATGGARVDRLDASLAALSSDTGGRLVVRTGDPEQVIPRLAAEVGARTVHVSRETTPYGRRRDDRVRAALAGSGRALVETGTPYAAGPGLVRTGAGIPYKVFTPFARAWRAHGWPAPADSADEVPWMGSVAGEPVAPRSSSLEAGEAAALRRWHAFLESSLDGYAEDRNRPDLDSTSRLSSFLHFGEIHPRTLLADLARQPQELTRDVERFVTELAWREFYADVLWHRPDSAWQDLRPEVSGLVHDSGPATDALVDAWRRGKTGYPFVDAGLRQLLAEGWMHNRLRMVTASFLVKDLHIRWQVGARHFLDHLIDGDVASNNHGWQWVAGTGTDAAPYPRILNPVRQGHRFDPDGTYVRRWVPELRHLAGPAVHEPWEQLDGYAHGYPERLVDHAEARREAQDRYDRARGRW